MKKRIILILVLILFFLGITFLIFFGFVKKTELVKPERTELQLAHPELKIEDVVIGKGQKAEREKKLTLHYIGKLEDGKVFDSTYDKGRTFSFI